MDEWSFVDETVVIIYPNVNTIVLPEQKTVISRKREEITIIYLDPE